jgi:hypothetical protein
LLQHVAEAIASKGDPMEPNGKDVLIEEIDKELRAIDVKLKKILSKTDALLKEPANGTEEADNGGDKEQG